MHTSAKFKGREKMFCGTPFFENDNSSSREPLLPQLVIHLDHYQSALMLLGLMIMLSVFFLAGMLDDRDSLTVSILWLTEILHPINLISFTHPTSWLLGTALSIYKLILNKCLFQYCLPSNSKK